MRMFVGKTAEILAPAAVFASNGSGFISFPSEVVRSTTVAWEARRDGISGASGLRVEPDDCAGLVGFR